MNNKIVSIITFFCAGAALGGIGVKIALDKKYSKRFTEEIESVKSAYDRMAKELINDHYGCNDEVVEQIPNEKPSAPPKKPPLSVCTEKLRRAGYVDYAAISNQKSPQEEEDGIDEVVESNVFEDSAEIPNPDKPYIITPEQFSELESFEQMTLILYSDQVLATEDGRPVENIDRVIGVHALERFGEFDTDAVYVRNEVLKYDYEILKDENTFADAIKTKR